MVAVSIKYKVYSIKDISSEYISTHDVFRWWHYAATLTPTITLMCNFWDGVNIHGIRDHLTDTIARVVEQTRYKVQRIHSTKYTAQSIQSTKYHLTDTIAKVVEQTRYKECILYTLYSIFWREAASQDLISTLHFILYTLYSIFRRDAAGQASRHLHFVLYTLYLILYI